jgi:hypothetical protein
MFLWFPVLDLARAPRRTARKKGSGYENEGEGIVLQNNMTTLNGAICGGIADCLEYKYIIINTGIVEISNIKT